jgi:hypothetical protein
LRPEDSFPLVRRLPRQLRPTPNPRYMQSLKALRSRRQLDGRAAMPSHSIAGIVAQSLSNMNPYRLDAHRAAKLLAQNPAH